MNPLQPDPEHRFAFGLSTAGRRGYNPTGDSCPIEPWEFVDGIGGLGCWGASFHDDDLVAPEGTAAEHDDALARLGKALDATGVVVSMVATRFASPVFGEGAFTATDRDVRRHAIRKAMRAIDLGAELGAGLHAFRGGCPGPTAVGAKPPLDSLARYREALDFLCGYVADRGYDTRLVLEPASDPLGEIVLPTVGHALALIGALDVPAMVGLNPHAADGTTGVAYEGVAQALDAGKLWHVDLNAGPAPRREGSTPFGSARITDAFFLVKLLEESGYEGPRHFDVGPSELTDGTRLGEIAGGWIRTYLALAAKARRFADDPEIQDALAACGAAELASATVGGFTPAAAATLAAEPFDPESAATRARGTERLDRAISELILGLR